MYSQYVHNDFDLRMQCRLESDTVRITYHEQNNYRALFRIDRNSFSLGRMRGGQECIWRTWIISPSADKAIRLLVRGSYTRVFVNGIEGWMRGVLGEWEEVYDPEDGVVEIDAPDGIPISSLTIEELPWLPRMDLPLIGTGPASSFYEQQIIPGAIVRWNGRYYMYFMAGRIGEEEGASGRTIGVASSPDLLRWDVHPEPVIRLGEPNYLHDNLYPSGSVVLPDGRIALMYASQKFPAWTGLGLATADNPFGPFMQSPRNPVYVHPTHHHEFDLVQAEPGKYLLFLSAFDEAPARGPAGDRGVLLESRDLEHWESAGVPSFAPETLDGWDAVHVRTRSLSRIGDVWYLWYEGVNTWTPPAQTISSDGALSARWYDTVGLARSRDLVHWEYYPRNPALPAVGVAADRFDSRWVGWPRMVMKEDTAYVFYAGGGKKPAVGVRTIPVRDLTDWNSEKGRLHSLI